MAQTWPDWQRALLQRNQLPESYLGSAQQWFGPMASIIAERQESAGRCILVAVNGCQGSGKSTLCDYLQALFREEYGLACVSLSLDDFYLTAPQRRQLAIDVHPLFATRGVPGTHDMGLLGRTLDALMAGLPAHIPRFDKTADDRYPASAWDYVDSPAQIVLLEGWCMGAMAQPIDELVEPINTLEAAEDPDGIWRNSVNAALSDKFSPLYQRVDEWVMLCAPSFACVYQWRLEQEQKLAAQKQGEAVMNAEQVARFVCHFQRLTEHCLSRLPRRVNHLLRLDPQRNIKTYTVAPGVRP
jgi:D-glycerate 3-kinase